MTKDIRIFTRPTGESYIEFSGSSASSTTLQVLSDGNITLGSNVFQSGFGGSGFKIGYDNSLHKATFDDLTVRGWLYVYSLLIHQIKAENRAIWVSKTGQVSESVSLGGSDYRLNFDVGQSFGHGFAANDLISMQR